MARSSDDVTRTLPVEGDMAVPGVVFASPALLPDDPSALFAQVRNVATLRGVVEASYAMPDVHVGYGFPIGGVAATDVDAGGVVSPGGVGFDISCGVRTLALPALAEEVDGRTLAALMDALAEAVPHGTGPGGLASPSEADLTRVLAEGAAAVVADGGGLPADLDRTEDRGRLAGADPDEVGAKARKRGRAQLGSLGGGNHFLEVEVVEEVADAEAAEVFGLAPGRLAATIHCGSRGLGHQVCTDAVGVMRAAMDRYDLAVPDAQLACVPVDSPEGRAYVAAMEAAANYARANRQLIAEAVRDACGAILGSREAVMVYDVNHNMAKRERHVVDGAARDLCVHRKGATLALPAGHPDLADDLAAVGQPVIVPGSMGTATWVLAGGRGRAFASTCHGAGRLRSRTQARKRIAPDVLARGLAAQGVEVRARSASGLAEEAPEVYKDVDEVVAVCEAAGLSRRVARLRPLGVVKG